MECSHKDRNINVCVCVCLVSAIRNCISEGNRVGDFISVGCVCDDWSRQSLFIKCHLQPYTSRCLFWHGTNQRLGFYLGRWMLTAKSAYASDFSKKLAWWFVYLFVCSDVQTRTFCILPLIHACWTERWVYKMKGKKHSVVGSMQKNKTIWWTWKDSAWKLCVSLKVCEQFHVSCVSKLPELTPK